MSLRRTLALAVALLALAGCTSVVQGRGATVRSSTSIGGFPSTTPSTTPPTSAPSEPRTGAIESPDGDFSVVLPAGWRDGTDQIGTLALTGYFGPTADGFATNVNVNRVPAPGSLAAVVHAAITQLQNTLHVTNMTPTTSRTLGGEPALEYSFTDQQAGRTLHQRQTIALHDGSGYVVTYTALTDAYEASLNDADAIIESWQWG